MTRCVSSAHSRKLIIGLALVGLAAACATKTPLASADIVVRYATGPAIRASDELDVFITNTSQGCIQFPDDFGLKIYYQQAGSWKETGNLMTYAPSQNNHLGPRGEPYETTSVSLIPDLRAVEVGGSLPMKATIKGHLCSNPAATIEKDIPFTVVK